MKLAQIALRTALSNVLNSARSSEQHGTTVRSPRQIRSHSALDGDMIHRMSPRVPHGWVLTERD